MAMETQLDNLLREDSLDANKILSLLLDPDNIDMKTHVCDPITFAVLESIVNQFEDMVTGLEKQKLKLPITKKMLKDIIVLLKKFLVSWDRQSRIEITETLKAIKEEGTGAKSLFQTIAGLGK